MGKIKIFSPILIIFLLYSCKKDYTCTCTKGGLHDQTYIIGKTSKKKAEQQCSETYKDILGTHDRICEIE